jgi:ankyrin repeat protein
MDVLLRKKAKPNTMDTYGRSALAYAIENGQEDMVELLIANGADVNLYHESDPDRERWSKLVPGFRPLVIAARSNASTKIVTQLINEDSS